MMLKRILLFLVITSSGSSIVAQTSESEAALKAVFIYNFTQYIEWDSTAMKNDFVIGVVGSSGVTKSLQQIARTKTVKNKKIIVRVFSKPEEIGGCHILFIPQKLPYPLQAVLEKVRRETLTVSEQPGYARMGTAFNFIIEKDKLRFEANLKAISSSGLKAGSQLLKLATIVEN